ncbi:membrane-associated protease 1 [Paenibacillus kobensis]|uniref:membrane-associated protease 1 n=1 Tax=Paenibacillus kobensis TaxID=59841 RepID=UPI000FDBA518|nr:membrane-associated protease 1 [Paenibacillus kobensis]
MGFKLRVEGAEVIELGLDNIKTVKYEMDTPDDSNARSTDVGVTLRISGKIITSTDGDSADDTRKLALWSLVPAEKADCYRKVSLEVIAADQVVRKISFPNAFVVDYTESFGDTEGVGEFNLYIKQKKDKTEFAQVDGGYPVS